MILSGTIQNRLEELSLNALPALHTTIYDGWILRFSKSYNKRTNSILPLYKGSQSSKEKIIRCEQIYNNLNTPAVYKITDHPELKQLDQTLDQYHYQLVTPTYVQTKLLEPYPAAKREHIKIAEEWDQEWFRYFCRVKQLSSDMETIQSDMFQKQNLPFCFVSVMHNGSIAAGGHAVIEDGYVGIFHIHTHPSYRKQGFAETLVRSILDWGYNQGAHTAYLQVTEENRAARNLYQKLGFSAAYKYWFRVQPL